MSFREDTLIHLSEYREKVLCIKESGIFNYRGRKIPKDHILPNPVIFKRLNIIDIFRDDFYNSIYSDISFHIYFHHLNSSQGLCVNLFYPLINNDRLNILLDLLNINDSPSSASFEKKSMLERVLKNKRKTTFDFYIKTLEGIDIYFEIKYTEREFGKVKHDEEHIKKFQYTYKPLLLKNPYINDEYKSQDYFLSNYQIMRNLVHLSDFSFVIFIYPIPNKIIHKQTITALKDIVTKEGRKKFIVLPLERLVSDLIKSDINQSLLNHYNKFSNKYLFYTK